jgi:hypothetical protein
MNTIKNSELVDQLCAEFKSVLNDSYKEFAQREYVTKDAKLWCQIVRESLGGIGVEKLKNSIKTSYIGSTHIQNAIRKANKELSKSSRTFHRNIMLQERGISVQQFNDLH